MLYRITAQPAEVTQLSPEPPPKNHESEPAILASPQARDGIGHTPSFLAYPNCTPYSEYGEDWTRTSSASLQETHLHTSDEATLLRQTEQRLYTAAPEDGFRRYTPIWGDNDEALSAGVALLVRSSLIECGALKIHGHTHADPDGSLMQTRIEWKGYHILNLACELKPEERST